MENKEIVLSVKDLKINFSTDHGYVQAVRGVSFDLYKGETLCIVGESGSGKSVTSKTIMGILSANGRIMGGSIMYEGEDLTKVSEDEFHRIRGHKIGMIFQDPLSSLNPIVRIGKQITEAMLINSNRIKTYYENLVSKEFVAYKNAQTEYETGLKYGKERIKFLKAEKKKEIAKIKGEPSMFRSGSFYTLKLERDGKILSIREEFNNKVFNLKKEKYDTLRVLKKNSTSPNEYETRGKEIDDKFDRDVELLKSQKAAKLQEISEWYKVESAKINQEAKALKAEFPAKVMEAKNRFDQEMLEAKTNSDNSKDALKEKYIPLIKETKAAYKARAKVAKEEVKEYEASLKAKYENKVNYAKSYLTDEEEIKRICKEAKSEYVSATKITKAEAKARALKIMAEVGISNPEKRFRQYPFEFSGGMRQRIVIAIALTANPDILICDEPTTALDVTIQAQILELINRLKKERNISVIFITHDLGVVANMADRVAVMYAGKIVEYGTEDDIFYDPRHPYTWALLSSIPDIDSKEKLEAIPGTPPNMIYPPKGDAFALRSKYALAIDFKKEPPMFKISDTHYAATWLLDPRAPKVEMPKIVKTRIENSLKAAKKGGEQ